MNVSSFRFINRIKLFPYDLGLIFGIISIIGGFCLVVWQVFVWLDEKVWYSYSLYTLVDYCLRNYLPMEFQWFYQPHRMLGLHTLLVWVLEFAPISLILIIGGMGVVGFLSDQREHVQKRNTKRTVKALGLEYFILLEIPPMTGSRVRMNGRLTYFRDSDCSTFYRSL